MRTASGSPHSKNGGWSQTLRVLRGGSYNNNAENLRCGARWVDRPGNNNNNGLRVARDVEWPGGSFASPTIAGAARIKVLAGVRLPLPDRQPDAWTKIRHRIQTATPALW